MSPSANKFGVLKSLEGTIRSQQKDVLCENLFHFHGEKKKIINKNIIFFNPVSGGIISEMLKRLIHLNSLEVGCHFLA